MSRQIMIQQYVYLWLRLILLLQWLPLLLLIDLSREN